AGDAELDAGASSVVKKRLSKKAKAAREQRRAAAEARRQAREAKSREASQQQTKSGEVKSGEVKSDEAKPRNAEQPASSGNDDRDVVRLSDETPITISLEKLRLAIANSIASTQPAGVQPQTPATQSSEASQPAAKSATPIVVEVPTAVSTTTPVIESPTSVAVKPAEVIDKPTSPEATQTKTNSPATHASPASKPEAGISEPTATAPAAALKIETKPEATIEPPAPSVAIPQTAANPQTDAAPKSTPLAKAEAAPSTPPAPKSQTAAKPEATVKSPPSSKPKAAPKPRVFFQPEWEVDRFAWPETCEALYRDQQQYFSDAGRRLKAASGDGLNVLAITSPRRGDGKTTLALCLARCAVEAGVRVALVDADFAYPQLQSLLGLNETCSWHESFQTALPLAECAIVSRDDELVIFPLAQSARAVNVHATRDAIAAEIQRIAGQFELVIVDLGSMDADAADLCDAAATNPTNAVILVRDLRNEDDAEIDDAVARIQAAGISAVGIAENFGSRQPKA
ncbi:MAG: hypothetical protein KDA55_18255, partial [Planctomycetales bacterium]|nr:hypothetical protein [Planctomycetales bacterium]